MTLKPWPRGNSTIFAIFQYLIFCLCLYCKISIKLPDTQSKADELCQPCKRVACSRLKVHRSQLLEGFECCPETVLKRAESNSSTLCCLSHLNFQGTQSKIITHLWEFPCQSYRLHPIPGYQFIWHCTTAMNPTRTQHLHPQRTPPPAEEVLGGSRWITAQACQRKQAPRSASSVFHQTKQVPVHFCQHLWCLPQSSFQREKDCQDHTDKISVEQKVVWPDHTQETVTRSTKHSRVSD